LDISSLGKVTKMNCPKCETIMHNYDEVNFLCPRCRHVKYVSSPVRESYLLSRGHKTCPVCGHIAVINNGGHVCLKCVAKIERKSHNLIRLSPAVLMSMPTYRSRDGGIFYLGMAIWMFGYLVGMMVIL